MNSQFPDRSKTSFDIAPRTAIVRENTTNRENLVGRGSSASQISDKSINDKAHRHIIDRYVVKSKGAAIYPNKINKKPVKKIKHSSIKKRNKENTNLNFGSKVVSSVKNAGTSRASYNQIFYSNKSKSSLKNYNNATRNYPLKKKSTNRESNSNTNISYLSKNSLKPSQKVPFNPLQNRKKTTNSSRNMTSDKKMHKTESSPINQNGKESKLENYLGGIKTKLIKTISSQSMGVNKLKTRNTVKLKPSETEYVMLQNHQNLTQDGKADYLSDSESSLSDSGEESLKCDSTNKKERKLRRMIKQANEDLFMAAESGSLRLIKQLLMDSEIDFMPDVNFRGPDFKTPLYVATSEGHLEVVEFLLSVNAQVNTRTL